MIKRGMIAFLVLSLSASASRAGEHALPAQLSQAATPSVLSGGSTEELKLSASLSSWAPGSLMTESLDGGASAFARASGLPLAGVALRRAMHWAPSVLGLEFESGLAFLALDREGSTLSGRGTQLGYLFPVHLVARMSPGLASTRWFRSYASLGLMPTALVVARSTFDEGRTLVGLPLRLAAGFEIPVTNGAALDLGVVGAVGALEGERIDAFGATIGIGIGIGI